MSRYPDTLTVAKPRRSRSRREGSGVFQLFQTPQIQQFKEAFSLIDSDADGIVSEKDLKNIFANLGIAPSKKMLDDLLTDRPGTQSRYGIDDTAVVGDRGVNFTMFLTMMGERLFEFDHEQELIEAFACFDEDDTGLVRCDDIRKWLNEVGDRMDDTEIDRLLKGPYTDRQGNFNYREWVKVLRVNTEPEAETTA